ncbi:aldo/keto reductase [Arenibacter sp. ARW7G5Y1]|uniref:aldo/keto reductase n=1 Tax=Arenibacter sp. ARW7G5Y1 TaxID=2135619 RepID=UPI000D87CC2E|nr:aldo/keto reductase [Arenibacter sp. ARW7G5Y1]PXX30585.1 aryl-alcohol dehydrogenase-like predicted oxidoreductase [Arenibacter sp. ARW7G5Y1]
MTNNKRVFERVTLGTAGLGGAWYPVDLEKSVDTIHYALEQGITNLDMAPAYMDAELIVGKALRQWEGEAPFLSTKVGKRRGRADKQGLSDYRVNSIKSSVDRSLERLGRDNIDLLFLHEPGEVPVSALNGVMDTLLLFKDQGLVKKIGLGGKPPLVFAPFIEMGYFDVVMDFNGYNLVENKALKVDFPFYRRNKLEIYEGSPLMMGLLGSRLDTYAEKTPKWLPLKTLERAMTLRALASKFKMSLPSMAHRYLMLDYNIDRMVIGPDNLEQLKATLTDLKMGPLDKQLTMEIIKIIEI